MALVSTSRPSVLGFGVTLTTNVSLFIERIVRSFRQQQTYKSLMSLSAEQLADIGLSRKDVHEMKELGHDQALWRLSFARKKASLL